MGSTFNPQILMEKLAKLNSSQASIETLSHWCIFHMHKARQVVETWDRQFHCSPRDQRLAFLYLANDILQNSRRKGSEFVAEFWKFLPDALRDVIDNGDEFGRNAALRLISIWEERKVFGSRGQILKEELAGRHLDISNRNGKPVNTKPKHSGGNTVDKLVSSYQVVYGQLDEEVLLSKCQNAINFVEKVEKEVGSDISSGQFHGSTLVEELQGQHSVLRSCIEQLTTVESSRASLVSLLREALREQEFKLDQVRNQLQSAQSQSEQMSIIGRQLVGHENPKSIPDHSPIEVKEQSAPVMYAPALQPEVEDPRKSAAAAMAAKLTASTSSAQMLSFVLSSLASEGVIGTKDSISGDFPAEKRPKLDSDYAAPPPPPQQFAPTEQPPPPSSSPPPLPPLPPISQYTVPQFMQSAGPYSYSVVGPQGPPAMPSYSTLGAPVNGVVSPYTPTPNSYQFQGPDGNFYSQTTSMPMAPMSRQ